MRAADASLPGRGRAADAGPVALLLLDDSVSDRQIIQRLLITDPQREYVLREYAVIEDALEACLQSPPDCVLLDYSLGDGTGLDFLHAIKGLAETRDVPVVMLTGSGSEEVAAEAFRAGAHDYLAKGSLTADGLQRAISSAIFQVQTERLLEEQRQELARLYQEAHQANLLKDQFLATLSHELRTPLTPVLAAVTAARPYEMNPDEIEELLAMVRRNVLLEARLIDDLLDLTRIAKGKLLLEMQPCDAHAVLRHAIETTREDMTKKEMRFSVRLEAELHQVDADAARLQQVFWNLLKNAVKFTPTQGAVSISTAVVGDRLQVRVSDTGIGITPDALPKIFRAFEQDTDVPRRFGGLGLGLAIASALMEVHQGRLWAESAGRDQGSTFTVELPLLASVPSALSGSTSTRDGESPAPVVNRKEASSSDLLNGHVLLVEDHADSALVLARFLRRRGLSVSVAHSVAEAMRAFEQVEIDVLISDIGLPDGTGMDLIEKLARKRPVPGIALSGFGSEEDIARSRHAGFVDHLTKPIEWTKLLGTLTQLLATKRR